MQATKSKDISVYDLATYLSDLGQRLRIRGLALEGLAHQGGGPGDPDFKDLTAIAASLDAIADALWHISKELCPICRLADVKEQLVLGDSGASGSKVSRRRSRRYAIRRKAGRTSESAVAGYAAA